MAYSNKLRLQTITDGDKAGLWGDIVNKNIGTLLEEAIAGAATVVVASAAQALTATATDPPTTDEARQAVVLLTGTPGAAYAIYVPPQTKLYIIKNSVTTYTATIYCSTVLGNTTAAGTGIAIPSGYTAFVRSDGTNILSAVDYIPTLTVGAATITGSVSLPGAVPVASGGTGATTFTDGGVLVGNTAGAVQVTTAGTAGQVLVSGGAGVDPAFSDLTNPGYTAQTLTDSGATLPTWNLNSGGVATITLTGTGRTMASPTNMKVGVYILHLIQDATGSRTITTWGTAYHWQSNVPPVLSTGASKHDIISFVCDGTIMYGSYILDLRRT